VPLWLSDDEKRFGERLSLLSSLPEASFSEFMAKSRQSSSKKATFAESFLKKGQQLLDKQEIHKGLLCLGKALSFAEAGNQCHDILLVRCKAFLDAGRVTEALRDLDELKLAVKESNELSSRSIEGKRAALLSQLNALDTRAKEGNDSLQKSRAPDKEEHPWSVGLSKKVIIKEDSVRGRYLVATEALAAGECFAKDLAPPRLLIPSSGRVGASRCWHCLAVVALEAPCVCRCCSTVLFCSWKCSRFAWDSYHR